MTTQVVHQPSCDGSTKLSIITLRRAWSPQVASTIHSFAHLNCHFRTWIDHVMKISLSPSAGFFYSHSETNEWNSSTPAAGLATQGDMVRETFMGVAEI